MKLRAGLGALVLALAFSAQVGAQTPGTLTFACRAAGGSATVCPAMAYAAQAIEGHVTSAAGLGSEVPGTASNLGQRLGTSPRVAFEARYGWVRASLPELASPNGLGETTVSVPVAHVGVAVGLFDGFRLLPTVGGFLSLDVVGRAAFVRLPTDVFDASTSAYTLGARVGIFRESFTLPGVSVSVSRRFVGDVGYGDTSAGDAAGIILDPAVTSLRATVGKDLFAIEFMAGFGIDDVSADAGFTVTDGVGGTATGAGPIDVTRRHYFLGASRSFSLVLSISLELGYSTGFDSVPGYTGAFDPSGSALFGGFAFRLTI